jgi:hypothetical protein
MSKSAMTETGPDGPAIEETATGPAPGSATGDGKLFDDFFENIGDKVAQTEAADETEPKVVDEIESLCMNCHANVSSRDAAARR